MPRVEEPLRIEDGLAHAVDLHDTLPDYGHDENHDGEGDDERSPGGRLGTHGCDISDWCITGGLCGRCINMPL